MQRRVRFFALYRNKPHVPPLTSSTANPFEFKPCDFTPQAGCTAFAIAEFVNSFICTLRWRRRLQGYLIPFDTYASAAQRLSMYRVKPSLLAFHAICTFNRCLADSKLPDMTRAFLFKTVLTTFTVGSTFFVVKQSTRALSLVLTPNTRPLCLTATAGTVFVGAWHKGMWTYLIVINQTITHFMPFHVIHKSHV